MPQKPARRAYSAEQLLALRRSASDEPALAIQKRAQDGAIRDHVVRGARSLASRSSSSAFASEPLRLPPPNPPLPFTAPPLGEIDPNNQRLRIGTGLKSSPSPSIKKKKAEQILKQHGSPPNVRVTAGGRIVPSEQSPLCSPRYGYSAISKNGGLIKFAPGYPPQPRTFPNFAKSLPNGFVAQNTDGKLCQIVDGRFIEIQEVNGIPQLYITAPNITSLAWSQFDAANEQFNQHMSAVQTAPSAAPAPEPIKETAAPSTAAQVAALERQYQKLETERRNLDKAEVLRRSELTGKGYNHLVQKRRELINRQDELRRSIKLLNEASTHGDRNVPNGTSQSTPELQLPQFILPPHLAQSGHWVSASPFDPARGSVVVPGIMPDYSVLPSLNYPNHAPRTMPIQHFAPAPAGYAVTNEQIVAAISASNMSEDPALPKAPTNSSSGPGENVSNGRHEALDVPGQRSALNPMSPIYEPAQPQMTTPEKKHAGRLMRGLDRSVVVTATPHAGRNGLDIHEADTSFAASSGSSYATADFFPHNPKEHSLHKDAYPTLKLSSGQATKSSSLTTHQSTSDEAIAKPEMERHNVNWNPTIPDQAFHGNASDEGRRSVSGTLRSEAEPPLVHTDDDIANVDDFARGYTAGLRRDPIGLEKSKLFLDGYCKGLLQSVQTASSDDQASEPKPVVKLPIAQPVPAAPSPPPEISIPDRADHRPLHLDTASLEGLKQAINEPGNEHAILSPDPEGPSVDAIEGKFLGAWSKAGSSQTSNENANPQQSSAAQELVQHPGLISQGSKASLSQVKATDFAHVQGSASSKPQDPIGSHRTFSAQTQPAHSAEGTYLQRMYPGHRVLSTPVLEWKSPTGIAQMAGHATGFFAQFDGTTSKPGSSKSTAAGDVTKQPSSATKFKEASMPNDNGPPSPTKTSESGTPKKSPAKAKFAAIAGKAGIKVRTDRPLSKEKNELEPMSPQERRRWRDVWKKRNTGD